jgi:prevent-host-death family protein
MSSPVSATEAKNRFGQLCQQAKRAPVVVQKAGRPDTVLLSYEDYLRLSAPAVVATLAERRRAFSAEYQEWLAALNAQHVTAGLWNDDLRLW